MLSILVFSFSISTTLSKLSDWNSIRANLSWKSYSTICFQTNRKNILNRNELDCFLTDFHRTRSKTFFGWVRNDSKWFRNRFRNSSDLYALNSFPKLSPGYLKRNMHKKCYFSHNSLYIIFIVKFQQKLFTVFVTVQTVEIKIENYLQKDISI